MFLNVKNRNESSDIVRSAKVQWTALFDTYGFRCRNTDSAIIFRQVFHCAALAVSIAPLLIGESSVTPKQKECHVIAAEAGVRRRTTGFRVKPGMTDSEKFV